MAVQRANKDDTGLVTNCSFNQMNPFLPKYSNTYIAFCDLILLFKVPVSELAVLNVE